MNPYTRPWLMKTFLDLYNMLTISEEENQYMQSPYEGTIDCIAEIPGCYHRLH